MSLTSPSIWTLSVAFGSNGGLVVTVGTGDGAGQASASEVSREQGGGGGWPPPVQAAARNRNVIQQPSNLLTLGCTASLSLRDAQVVKPDGDGGVGGNRGMQRWSRATMPANWSYE